MTAARAPILTRHKEHVLFPASPDDFTCGPESPFEPASILTNPGVSLYCLDLRRRAALFVDTPRQLNSAEFPFLYQTQFAFATHLMSVPFETLSALAVSNDPRDTDLIFVHSVGRCGSTLVSNAFGAVPGVCSLSEPDVFTQLVDWRGTGALDERELANLAETSVRILCKPKQAERTCRRWAIKFRSQCLEIGDVILSAFPAARHVYLTREPLSWLASACGAFVDPALADGEDYKRAVEDMFARMLPLFRKLRSPGRPMPVWQSWLLNWIANTERYRELVDRGFSFLRVDFAEITQAPEATMRKIFTYCDLPLDEWAGVRAQLAKDSQENSVVARSKVDDLGKRLTPEVRMAAITILRDHGHSGEWPEPLV